jgi:hypothetical protein
MNTLYMYAYIHNHTYMREHLSIIIDTYTEELIYMCIAHDTRGLICTYVSATTLFIYNLYKFLSERF